MAKRIEWFASHCCSVSESEAESAATMVRFHLTWDALKEFCKSDIGILDDSLYDYLLELQLLRRYNVHHGAQLDVEWVAEVYSCLDEISTTLDSSTRDDIRYG